MIASCHFECPVGPDRVGLDSQPGLLRFGAITVIGLSTLVRAQVDLMESRNMIIVAIIMVTGLGGMVLNVGVTDLKGIGLGAILGVILNLVLPGKTDPEAS